MHETTLDFVKGFIDEKDMRNLHFVCPIRVKYIFFI